MTIDWKYRRCVRTWVHSRRRRTLLNHLNLSSMGGQGGGGRNSNIVQSSVKEKCQMPKFTQTKVNFAPLLDMVSLHFDFGHIRLESWSSSGSGSGIRTHRIWYFFMTGCGSRLSINVRIRFLASQNPLKSFIKSTATLLSKNELYYTIIWTSSECISELINKAEKF